MLTTTLCSPGTVCGRHAATTDARGLLGRTRDARDAGWLPARNATAVRPAASAASRLCAAPTGLPAAVRPAAAPATAAAIRSTADDGRIPADAADGHAGHERRPAASAARVHDRRQLDACAGAVIARCTRVVDGWRCATSTWICFYTWSSRFCYGHLDSTRHGRDR